MTASVGDQIGSSPTLLQRIVAEGEQYGLFNHFYRGHFEGCPRIEFSSGFEFFWGERKSDMRVELDVFPNLGVHIGLMVFIEGRAPERSPFAESNGRVGFAVMKTDRETAKAQGLQGELELLKATKAGSTLRIQPFWEFGEQIQTTPVSWHVPVKLDGRPSVSRAAPHPVISYGSPELCEIVLPEGDDTPREVRLATVDMLGGALFGICCMSAVRPEPDEGLVRWSGQPPQDAALDVGPLAQDLRDRGKADRLGLAHAMAVCRKDFT